MTRRYKNMPLKPPATAEDGALRVRAELVKVFDRRDGSGADWKLLLESLYRAGFAIVDERPDDEARQSLMRRVHSGAYARLTGDTDAVKPKDVKPASAPSISVAFKAARPRPPR